MSSQQLLGTRLKSLRQLLDDLEKSEVNVLTDEDTKRLSEAINAAWPNTYEAVSPRAERTFSLIGLLFVAAILAVIFTRWYCPMRDCATANDVGTHSITNVLPAA